MCLPTCNVIRWCLNNLVHVPSWCAAGKDAGVFINDTTEERLEQILSSSHSAGFEFFRKAVSTNSVNSVTTDSAVFI